MDGDKNKICRLCLKTCNENFDSIQDSTKENLDFLLVNMDFGISDDYVNCKKCVEMLQKCFDSKTVYVKTEEKLITFLNSRNINRTNIREVYLEDIQNHNSNPFYIDEICRFCMKPVTNFIVLDEIVDEYFSDMLQKFVPEVTLSITSNPVGCNDCLDSFKTCFTFLKYLGHVEEHIRAYREADNEIKREKVELSDVLQHIIKKISTECMDKETILTEEQLVETYLLGLTVIKNCVKDQKNEPIKKLMEEISVGENYDGENCKESSDQKCIKREEIEIKTEETVGGDVNRCHHCGNFITRKSSYKIYEKPDKSIIYKCCSCHDEFDEIKNAKEHVLSHKKPVISEEYLCFKCTNEEGMNQESNTELKPFKCPQCEFRTNCKPHIKRHLLVHKKPEEVEVYKCSKCTFTTKYKSSLKQHLLVHLQGEGHKKLKCSHCNYKTHKTYRMKIHQVVHLNCEETVMYKCEDCSYVTKHKHAIAGHKKQCKNYFKCQKCAYKTKIKESFLEHEFMHDRSDDFEILTCPQCGYITQLSDAIKLESSDEKPVNLNILQCPDCNHEIDIRQVRYEKLKILECRHCEYRTKSKKCFKAHLLVHKNAGEVEMFRCSQCSFKSKYKSNLNRHLLQHLPCEEIKKINCPDCNYKTYKMYMMKRHQVIHLKPEETIIYECENCTFKTKHKGSLTAHRKCCKKLFKCEGFE